MYFRTNEGFPIDNFCCAFSKIVQIKLKLELSSLQLKILNFVRKNTWLNTFSLFLCLPLSAFKSILEISLLLRPWWSSLQRKATRLSHQLCRGHWSIPSHRPPLLPAICHKVLGTNETSSSPFALTPPPSRTPCFAHLPHSSSRISHGTPSPFEGSCCEGAWPWDEVEKLDTNCLPVTSTDLKLHFTPTSGPLCGE